MLIDSSNFTGSYRNLNTEEVLSSEDDLFEENTDSERDELFQLVKFTPLLFRT